MKAEVSTAVRLVVLSMVACCVLYPGAMLAAAHMLVPWRAEGSLLMDARGSILGSELVAQDFKRPEYFWPRPSAVDYDASASGGSNLSPANPSLKDRAARSISRYHLRNGQKLPADLAAASGSGLDPDITLEAARFQAPRVAAARGFSEKEVEALIAASTEARGLLVFGGEPVVNVLRLNLALDGLHAARVK